MTKRRKGFYSISVVAKMFDVHQQTIRLYEKEGLISPQRTEGGTRMFSEEDVDKLEEIIHLTHKMGVNIAGVEMVLKLEKKIKKLQDDMNKLFSQTQGTLEEERVTLKEEVKKNAAGLAKIKHENQMRIGSDTSSNIIDSEETDESSDESSDSWEIDRDDL